MQGVACARHCEARDRKPGRRKPGRVHRDFPGTWVCPQGYWFNCFQTDQNGRAPDKTEGSCLSHTSSSGSRCKQPGAARLPRDHPGARIFLSCPLPPRRRLPSLTPSQNEPAQHRHTLISAWEKERKACGELGARRCHGRCCPRSGLTTPTPHRQAALTHMSTPGSQQPGKCRQESQPG